jgi:hypothetical protein
LTGTVRLQPLPAPSSRARLTYALALIAQLVMDIDLSTARNPSAVVWGRIRQAENNTLRARHPNNISLPNSVDFP